MNNQPGHASQITQLLQQVAAGDVKAHNALLDQVYAQLRAIAQKFINEERPGHTLQATALVHEAYLRMLGTSASNEVEWRNRRHFYSTAAEAMRRILIEHSRRRAAEKRGGGVRPQTLLHVCDLAEDDRSLEILALDEAILRLEQIDTTAAEIVRLRFFAGLSVDQTAAALDMSVRTVAREWTYARTKLFHLLEESSNP